MTYVIHGATGAQGGPVLAALKAAGHHVLAVTRNTNSNLAGVRTVNADYGSPEKLAEIYRGAAGVFVHLPAGTPGPLRAYAENIGAALVNARPARVIISTSGKTIDQPGQSLQEAEDAAIPYLVRCVKDAGLSYAVVSPLSFLENFLLPQVQDGVRAEGVLRYPLREDLPVSWTSHLDVADAVVALFKRPDISGVVGVGYEPGITGLDLAAAFSAHLHKTITYAGLEPDRFGQLLAPLLGEGPAAGVAARYRSINALPGHTIDTATSAQQRLGMAPRTLTQWLATTSN